jgi:predicted  nucleic acid-binding Zn-ribbon protein
MVVGPCAAAVLAVLRGQAARVDEWSAAPGEAAYGEPLVRALVAAMDERAPDGLVLPPPAGGDPAGLSLALAALEAARRRGGPVCAWPAAADPGAAPGAPPPWTVVEPADLFEAMLARSGSAAGAAPPALAIEAAAPGAARVSVVVRSVDRPSLAQALASIALQTYRPIEVVVVNARGAAHGPLPEVGAALQVRRVGADDGAPLRRAAAANAGLDAATGTEAIFLDDDDVLLPDHLSRLVPALAAHPDAGAVYTGVEHGRVEQGRWQVGHRFDDDFDPVRLLFENYLPIHGVLFRRSGPWRELRFDTAFDLFEDWDFWLQFAARGPLVHRPGVSARYVAGAAGGADSAVFDDSPAARDARQRLHAKWHALGGPAQTAAVLQRLQTEYRDAARCRAELALLQQGHGALRAVLAARDGELEAAARHRAGLEELLGARQRELAGALAEVAAWRETAAARERELADAQAQIAGLREILVEREREIADAQVQIDGLRGILGHRDRELADAAVQIDDLRRVLADRERELAAGADRIASLHRDLESQQAANSTLAGQLAELHAEGPWRALSRTLRGKSDAPRS